MNRTLLLLVLFLLMGAAVWFLVAPANDGTTLAGWDRDFAVEDTARIHRIFIADREGAQTILERSNGHWVFNKRWKARPNAMDNLLDAVRRIEMQYRPPKAMEKNMIRDLAANGIKVELYDRNEKLLKAYYVGGGTADERGTYVIMDGAEQPYVAHLPGWSGNLRFRFSLKGEDWRDKNVFDLRPEEIRSVSIEYPQQRNKSFRLQRQGNRYEVRPFYRLTPALAKPVQQGKVEAFLTGFKSLGAEAFENQNPRRDSVLRLVPFSIITVTDIRGDSSSVRLFPILPDYNAPSQPLPGSPTVERYFAGLSNGDFMLVQHRVFRRVLWGYEFFF